MNSSLEGGDPPEPLIEVFLGPCRITVVQNPQKASFNSGPVDFENELFHTTQPHFFWLDRLQGFSTKYTRYFLVTPNGTCSYFLSFSVSYIEHLVPTERIYHFVMLIRLQQFSLEE